MNDPLRNSLDELLRYWLNDLLRNWLNESLRNYFWKPMKKSCGCKAGQTEKDGCNNNNNECKSTCKSRIESYGFANAVTKVGKERVRKWQATLHWLTRSRQITLPHRILILLKAFHTNIWTFFNFNWWKWLSSWIFFKNNQSRLYDYYHR